VTAAGHEQVRRVRVPEIVKPDARERRSLYRPRPRLGERVRPELGSVGTGEHPAALAPAGTHEEPQLGLTTLPGAQHLDRRVVELDGALRPLGPGDALEHLVADLIERHRELDRPRREVDVPPAQSGASPRRRPVNAIVCHSGA
jgi:hypothetical protein